MKHLKKFNEGITDWFKKKEVSKETIDNEDVRHANIILSNLSRATDFKHISYGAITFKIKGEKESIEYLYSN